MNENKRKRGWDIIGNDLRDNRFKILAPVMHK